MFICFDVHFVPGALENLKFHLIQAAHRSLGTGDGIDFLLSEFGSIHGVPLATVLELALDVGIGDLASQPGMPEGVLAVDPSNRLIKQVVGMEPALQFRLAESHLENLGLGAVVVPKH